MIFKKVINLKNLVLSKLDNLLDNTKLIIEKIEVVLGQNEKILNQKEATENNYAVIKKINNDPVDNFHGDFYIRHNQRRLEHLASLHLPICGTKLLEVGAGIGDHTSFFLDRGCAVVTTEARKDNLDLLRNRYHWIRVEHLDLDEPQGLENELFDIVYCYGLLYHLQKPAQAIEFMAHHCTKMLLLETCVSLGDGEEINLCDEQGDNPTQSFSGKGCRPTRNWVFNCLKKHFDFVYMPITQPNHPEFPLDWTNLNSSENLTISIFIASREKINNNLLLEDIPLQQIHQQ